jgi:twinkle protein
MFKSSSSKSVHEEAHRKERFKNMLSFGVKYLDDSLAGIMPSDLIVVGAPSGAGKTQFCVNVALSNIAQGKRVHYFALEADDYEIETRLKFQIVASIYFSKTDKPYLTKPFNFTNWMIGELGPNIEPVEKEANEIFENEFKNLFTYYKSGTFNINTLIENVLLIEEETDLIIIDHVHYFDWDDDSDNRAIKKIAMTARDLCLESKKPIILVSHLRKKDKLNKELVASLEEFHGSSEIFKIATRVITLAAGGPTGDGRYYTFFRTPKNRLDGGSTRFLGMTIFNPTRGSYENGYKVGWANAQAFGELTTGELPDWAKGI